MRKIIGIAVLLLLSSILFAEINYLPVSQVKPGIRGYLSTVFNGVILDKVAIEIKGITEEQLNGQRMPIIWAWAYPEADQPVPAAGQSGSPVLIYTDQGEIFLGMLAYSPSAMDKSPVFGITPYEYILKNSNGHVSQSIFQNNGHLRLPISFSASNKTVFNLDLAQIFPETEFKILSASTQNNNQNGPSNNPAVEIKPGLPINIYLVRGDMNLYAHGTLGVIDSKVFIALGHRIFNTGDSDLPVYPAQVITTVENYWMSYRLPGPDVGPLIGTITTDTYWGVKGEIGRQPRMIPVHLDFQKDIFSQQRNFEIVRIKYTPQLLSEIVWYYLLNIGTEANIESLSRGSFSISAIFYFKNRNPYVQTQIYDFENNYPQVASQYSKFLYQNILLPIFADPEMLTNLDGINFEVKVIPDFQKLTLEKIKIKGAIKSKKKINMELSLLSTDGIITRYKTDLQIVCPAGIKKGKGWLELRTGTFFPEPSSSYKKTEDYLKIQSNTIIFVKAVFYLEDQVGYQTKEQVRVNVGVDNEKQLIWQVEKLPKGEKIELWFELRLPVKAAVLVNMIAVPNENGYFDIKR